MINKTYIKSRKIWKVEFVLRVEECPKHLEVQTVHLVGDFNKWADDATPMVLSKGAYRTTLELPPRSEYQFRYLINGKIWQNDWDSDAYTPNIYGQDNCVVMLPES